MEKIIIELYNQKIISFKDYAHLIALDQKEQKIQIDNIYKNLYNVEG